jgi:hypothetical protein
MPSLTPDRSLVKTWTGQITCQQQRVPHREERMAGYEGTWEGVMNAALERMIRDVATDPKFVQTFKGAASPR